jgi:hypothetical protein
MRGSARALLGALLVAAALADSAAAAGRIDSISPAVADRGELVTITGKGFGAGNVRITVGGRTAQVVSAIGSKATFRVPALAGPGASTVRATNPGGHSGTIGLHVHFDGVSTPVLDAPRRVSAIVGRAGGTLGSGGLTLAIPAGALSEDTTIALTPLLDLADSPLAGTVVGGAKLEPEGLRFLRPAVLSFALPAGTRAADVLGFGSAGDGSELHLQPHGSSGEAISLQLWHFSTAGASSGGAAAAAGLLSRPISNAERQANQRIAAAHRACNAEVGQGILDGPACADVVPETVRALFDWYANAVRPGLQAAADALSFAAETTLAEWLAWEAEVRELFRNVAPPACGTLQNECEVAHALATTAVAAHARRRLDNCTGTSLASQLRDVARMGDFAGAGAIDITTLGLPDATSGALLRACAHLEIAITDFPAIAARLHANTLRGRVTVDVHTGPDRTDVPLTLEVDGSDVATAADGTFLTTVTPGATGPLDVELEAVATNPSLQNTSFTAIRNLSRPTRDRLKLVAQSPTSVGTGGTVSLLVQVAGDGMSGGTVVLTVGGPGTIAPPNVTTDTNGEATAVYTAPADTLVTAANVNAVLADGTSAAVSIAIAPFVLVGLAPMSTTLSPGQSVDLTATVTGTLVTAVTWTATGGEVVSTGSNTARYVAGSNPGTFSVTATSIADPAATASATITIVDLPTGVVRETSRGLASVVVINVPGPTCGFVDSDPGDTSWSDTMSCSGSEAEHRASGTFATSFVESYRGAHLSSLSATGAGSASGTERGVGSASGQYTVTVVLTQTTEVSLDVSLETSTGEVQFFLIGPGIQLIHRAAGDLDETRTLQPGRYHIGITATAVGSEGSGSASFGLEVRFRR